MALSARRQPGDHGGNLRDNPNKDVSGLSLGEGNLKRDFRVLSPGGESKREDTWYLLELAPVEPQVDIQRLVLTVDPKRYLIVQTDIYDAFENVNRIRFSRIKVDRNLPDSLFIFTIPPGAQVLRSSGEFTQ
jgi:outer membrane lipoprotein-sorting protein